MPWVDGACGLRIPVRPRLADEEALRRWQDFTQEFIIATGSWKSPRPPAGASVVAQRKY